MRKVPQDGDDNAVDPPPDLVDTSDDESECSEPSATPRSNDYWEIGGDVLVRVHVDPRRKMFTPVHCPDASPVPPENLDVARATHTDLDSPELERIDDCWTGHLSDEYMPASEWTGETKFDVILPSLDHGGAGRTLMQRQAGRITRVQVNSTRPPDLWPEI